MSDVAKTGTILFAQSDKFSLTNDAVEVALKRQLPSNVELVCIRTYPIIKKNPFLLILCLLGVVLYYGIGSLRSREIFLSRLSSTPVYFWLASRIVKRGISKAKDPIAVLQTQGLFNAKVDGVPLVVYTDNTVINLDNKFNPNSIILKSFVAREKKLYEDASYIAVAAAHVEQSLVDNYGIDKSKVRVIYMGSHAVAAPEFNAARYERQKLLFVGIDWKRKGGDLLLEAFRRLAPNFPNAVLTIVGSSEGSGIPNVIPMGRQSKEAVADLIRDSSIYCQPSSTEPFGIAAVEASQAGLPVVATAVGGLKDIVDDGKTGILVKPNDVDSLEAALRTLLSDPELCERMGRAGSVRAQRFSWSSVASELIELLGLRSSAAGA